MAAENSCQEPEFISYLLSSKLKSDCIFLVGNEKHMKPEQIGVVKGMLMAHSTVLRLELEDSKLAEKGVVTVTDIYPDTFKTLLRYVYGYDTTAALCFDEADNLFYVAEKYMMKTLKKKLATRLMSLLNTENICSLLNNPACYTDLELGSAITEILRYETDQVLASPLFLGLSSAGFIKILEQDGLNVPEIELWRAMMKWAKHNADSENGKALRRQVSMLTKHIRICTLSTDQFCREVMPTRLLSECEMVLVCDSIVKQEKQDDLTELCNEINPRNLVQKKPRNLVQKKLKFESKKKHSVLKLFRYTEISGTLFLESNFTVITKKCAIELLPWECVARDPHPMIPEGATYNIGCTITITRNTYNLNNTSTEGPVTVRFNGRVEYGKSFLIPLTIGGGKVTLLPNNKYTFRMVFTGRTRMYYDGEECIRNGCYHYNNEHLSLDVNCHYIPMNCFSYKAISVE